MAMLMCVADSCDITEGGGVRIPKHLVVVLASGAADGVSSTAPSCLQESHRKCSVR
jgi:hypothetical protein